MSVRLQHRYAWFRNQNKDRSLHSRVSYISGQPVDSDTQQRRGNLPTPVRGCFKNDAGIRRSVQPGVIQDFLLQLSGTPSGEAQGNERLIGTMTGGYRLQDIPGSGYTDFIADDYRGFPAFQRAMDHKAAIRMYRTALVHRYIFDFLSTGFQRHLRQY